MQSKAPRYRFTDDLPVISQPDLPGFDFLSVAGMAIASFSGGLFFTQLFPDAQMSRDYLHMLAEGQTWIEAGLSSVGQFAALLA